MARIGNKNIILLIKFLLRKGAKINGERVVKWATLTVRKYVTVLKCGRMTKIRELEKKHRELTKVNYLGCSKLKGITLSKYLLSVKQNLSISAVCDELRLYGTV